MGKVWLKLVIVMTVGLVILPSLAVGMSVTMGASQTVNLQSDPRHTGLGRVNTSSNPGGIEWDFHMTNGTEYGGEVGGAAVAADGNIYFTSTLGWLYSLHQNGSLRWKFNADAAIYTMPVIGIDGSVLFVCGPNIRGYSQVGNLTKVYLFSVSAYGTELWRVMLNSGYAGAPLVSDEGLIYVSGESSLTCIEPNGSVLWEQHLPGPTPWCSPAIHGDMVYVSTMSEVWRVSRSNGSLAGSCYLTNSTDYYPNFVSIGSDGTIYVGASNRTLYALAPDLTLKWRFTASGALNNAPAIGKDGTLYIGSMIYFDSNRDMVISNKNIYAITPDGNLKWNVSVDGDVVSTVIVSNDSRIYASTGGSLQCMDVDGKVVWTATGFFTPSHAISNPVPLAFGVDGAILVPTAQGLCAIGPGLPCPPNNARIWYGQDRNELAWSYPADGGSKITGYKLFRHAYDPVGRTSEVTEINLTADRMSYADHDLNGSKRYTYEVASVNDNGISSKELITDPLSLPQTDPLIILGVVLVSIWIAVAAIVIWERRKGSAGEEP